MNKLLAMIILLCFTLESYSQPNSLGSKIPRTSWGSPDLQGVWTAATVTPLERPLSLGDKPILTEEERAKIEIEREQFLQSRSANPDPGTPGGYNRFWLDSGTLTLEDGRSSLRMTGLQKQVMITLEQVT